ncbi:MAG: hypothetical protein IT499_08515 [Rubrivivax sp.]|nr:hypothetical protein [Rubrivivax sp.]MCL4699125.1 hypothetical protein [Burkholderiaceae bacterium]NUP87297.1 hypothetical protein [Burkholderiaceae bacterium]
MSAMTVFNHLQPMPSGPIAGQRCTWRVAFHATLVAVLVGLPAVLVGAHTTIHRVGGEGGTATVVMDCGPDAFMVGLSAHGARDNPIAPNLVRKLRFACRTFSGATPGSSTSQTREAAAGVQGSLNASQSSVQCPQDRVIHSLEIYAGLFIDRIAKVECRGPSSQQTWLNVNVGGDGGSRQFLECPNGEGLAKVEARIGSSIDSLKGNCRPFGEAAQQPLTVQIDSTLIPRPTGAKPEKILPAKAAVFSFRIAGTVNRNTSIGIFGETDLLGGAATNPPEFKLEVINPAGSVVASRTVRKPPAGTVQSVSVTINAAGTWKLRVTNLKKSYGALDVKSVSGGA